MQIKFEEATPKQLVEFGSRHLGLVDLTYQLGHAKLIAKIKEAGWEQDFVEIEELQPDQIIRREPPRSIGSEALSFHDRLNPYNPDGSIKRRMCGVLIPRQEGVVGGREPVYCNVNGKTILIPRGQRVRVPMEYVTESLDHAVQLIYNTDENGTFIGKPEEVHIYGFSTFEEDPDWEAMAAEMARAKAA